MKIGVSAIRLYLVVATFGLCQAQELLLRDMAKALPIPVLANPLVNDKGQRYKLRVRDSVSVSPVLSSDSYHI